MDAAESRKDRTIPIPVQTTAPRRLLRDVVFDTVHEAIRSGVLAPGERLSDDDLSEWLGMSRTPIREGMAMLRTAGLIEMEANRFTRVASHSAEEFADADRFLRDLHSIAIRETDFDPSTIRYIADRASAIGDLEESRDTAALLAVLDLYAEVVEARGGRLLIAAERDARGRMEFHSRAPSVSVDWRAHEASRRALAALRSSM